MKIRDIKLGQFTTKEILSRDIIGATFRSETPRASVKFVKKILGTKPLIACEIGVCDGHNSVSILKNLNINKLYLIDPYQSYDEEGIPSAYNLDLNKNIAEKRLKKFKDKIVWIRKESVKAPKDIPEKIDYVYIDGNHDYEHVKEDIETYFPKLSRGGVLAGHDIENGLTPNHDGVIKAVVEFATNNNLKLYFHAPDWWVVNESIEKKKR